MKRFLAVMKRLLFPGWRWVLLLTLLGEGSLALTFLVLGTGHPLAYLSYPLSAYAFVVLAAAVVPATAGVRRAIHRIPAVQRYFSDRFFQVRASLLLSFFINLCYAGVRLGCACWFYSLWDGALAVYNLLLCGVRLYLIRQLPGEDRDRDREMLRQLRCYRNAGLLLMALDFVLCGIAVQAVRDGFGYDYPGMLIYAAALHAFYCLILSVVNAVRFRKYHSPVLSAAKAVNLTTALVSVFNLETAMLARFGGGARFRLVMTGCTAAGVCALVLGIAVRMVVSANKKTRRLSA